MDMLDQGPDWATFSDGARVSWQGYLNCTCLTFKRQQATRACCKHTVYVIRTKLDVLVEGFWHPIPVVLTDEDGAAAWIPVMRDGNKLYADVWTNTLIGAEVQCRLDARNLVIPYLLGLANKVPCSDCTGTETWTEQQIIRRVCFMLENLNSGVCIYHSLDDLIPTF